jgi:hypothetical protein
VKTWRFRIEHSCTRGDTFAEAVSAFETFRESNDYSVDVGPMKEYEPNLIRVTVMGNHILVAVLFDDKRTLVSISAPESIAWAESLVRSRIEGAIRELLLQAGSDFVEITEL